ncbi:hypothetical protein BsWGS_14377 [Bradybaena similaris]
MDNGDTLANVTAMSEFKLATETDSSPHADAGSIQNCEASHSNASAMTSADTSRQRGGRWSIIAGALRNLKRRFHHEAAEGGVPYTDETDEGVSSDISGSSAEGLSTPENLSPKESVDLTDTENVEMAEISKTGEAQKVRTRVVEASPPAAQKVGSQTTNGRGEELAHAGDETASATARLPEALKNGLVVMLSGLYGITLVVMGLVLPLSEVFLHSEHPYFFEVFYLYLYSVSMAFLVYVYTYLLRKERLFILSLPRTISLTLSRAKSRSSLRSRRSSATSEKSVGAGKPLVRYNSTLSSLSMKRRRKIAYNPEINAHTGSFFLRVGVVVFGIGSMIHSCLIFGHYFEIRHLANHCSNAVQAVKPFALLCFTFVQMYFIFMNSKMCIHKYKTLARFGLMHMSCTNICVWLRSIVLETLLVMKVHQRDLDNSLTHSTSEVPAGDHKGGPHVDFNHPAVDIPSEEEPEFMSELSCNVDVMMGKIVESSSVYLYPCTIEYSLVCACVLYVMWTNVGEGITTAKAESCSDIGTQDSDEDSDDEQGHHKMSVDCASSSRGLFLGIFLFVAAVVCLVCYYVLSSTATHVTSGTLLGHICEEVILVVTFVATIIASVQMHQMHFSVKQKVGIEEILTLISISGLLLYGAWSIVAAMFYLNTLHGRLTVITNFFMVVQAASQAAFTFLALRASARDNEQLRTKPGRECVTFLLICNFALWVINTFETQRLEHNQTQVDFYGTTAWSIFSHISVPLGIYFRFHSTVNLSIIWKKAWKKKEAKHDPHGPKTR